jgi:hypothetical protein
VLFDHPKFVCLFDPGMNTSRHRFSTSALGLLFFILGIVVTIVFSTSTIKDMSSSSIEYHKGFNTQIWEENKQVSNIYVFFIEIYQVKMHVPV